MHARLRRQLRECAGHPEDRSKWFVERPDTVFNMILIAGICVEEPVHLSGPRREAAPSKVLAEQTRGRIQKEGSAKVKVDNY